MNTVIDVADIPLEVPDKLSHPNEFAIRVTNILKRVNFPGREKIMLQFLSSGSYGGGDMTVVETAYITMKAECIDSKSGRMMIVDHSTDLRSNMSDQEIVAQLFIITSQFAVHEFMENFRYDGAIFWDPHNYQAGLLEAIRRMGMAVITPENRTGVKFPEYVVVNVEVPTPKPTPHTFIPPLNVKEEQRQTKKPKQEGPKREKFWHKFTPERQWSHNPFKKSG